VRREAARNRMVTVGGVGVAITTEQERIEAAFHECTLALQARSREEHVLRWIYRSENMGQAGRRGSPTSLKIGPGGQRGGQRRQSGCFVRVARARVPRADVTRLFLGSRIYEFTFLA
jgi:hypothetical protein